MNMDEKLERLAIMTGLIENKKGKKNNFTMFDKVYPQSNEQLSQYFSSMGLNGKNVLTVGSSGDQVLYAGLYGAKKIVCFDINPFTKYYYDYKVAIIKALSFDEFKQCFNFDKNNRLNSKTFLSYKLYGKISHLLPEKSRAFWDNVFLESNEVEYFTHPCIRGDYVGLYSSDENQYNEIKAMLLTCPPQVKFINCDITEIVDKIGQQEKFDVIFLSNIIDYLFPNEPLKKKLAKFKNLIDTFKPITNPNAKIQLEYVFDEFDTEYDEDWIEACAENFGKDKLSSIYTELGRAIIYYPFSNEKVDMERE